MKKMLFALCFTLTLFTSCEWFKNNEDKICDLVRFADMAIPKVLQLLDNFGYPVVINGQAVTDVNELYYNYRTGEVFTHLFPPQYGVFLGDVLDIGTRAFNNWYDTECEQGADAPESYTNPNLTYSGPAGFGMAPLQPNYTPPITQNYPTGGFTYTTYQVNAPGYYRVDFNANYDQRFGEHGFDNNLYDGSQGGNPFGRMDPKQGWLEVTEPSAQAPWFNTDLPTEIVATCDFYKQYSRGTTAGNYLQSPLARFLQSPENLVKFYEFKAANPDQAFIIK